MNDPLLHRFAGAAAEAAATLARSADGAAEELVVLQAEVAARDGEVERLQEVCDDRQRVIDELGEHAATYRRAAEERAGLIAAIDFELQRLRGDLERTERELIAARAAADASTLALDEERQRTRLLSGERDAALRAANREVETLRARVALLEGGLAARTALVEELQAAGAVQLGETERLTEEVNALWLVAEERRLLLETNEARYRERSANAAPARDGVDWRVVALERERALQDVNDEADRRAVLLAEATAALEARSREVETLHARHAVLESGLTARSALADELQAACADRLGVIEQLTEEINALRLVAEERRLLLETNEARYRERSAAIPAPARDGVDWRVVALERERALQDVSAEAERRAVLLAELTARLEASSHEKGAENDGVDWHAVAEERGRALQEVSVEAERRSVLLAEVTAALEGRTREIDDLRKRLTRAS